MSHQYKSIAIIDSGIGGLSIFQEVKKIMPHQSIIYCCDSAGFPYGSKNAKSIVSRVKYCIDKLLKIYDISMVVVACNTASIHTLQVLRSIYEFQIVGVVPAIKTAGILSEKRSIGLLATPQTIASNYVDNLITKFISDCHVIKLGTTALVRMAENRICLGIEPETEKLRSIIKPLFATDNYPDTIVLGCTHFAFLIDLFVQITEKSIKWVETSSAIASHINTIIKLTEKDSTNNNSFVVTCNQKYNHLFLDYLNKIGFKNTYRLTTSVS